MEAEKRKGRQKASIMAGIFVIVNLLAVLAVGWEEYRTATGSLGGHAGETMGRFEGIMDDYERSFQLFVQMMGREIERDPDPEAVLAYLKGVDATLLDIQGETYDGLYMYYQGRYLYSWDTPYSVYEASGYEATERPWYQDAAAGGGDVVFTPPYMSYANHYILTTISQLQPDGETVFAYDIKMGDIQELVSSLDYFEGEQLMIFDRGGTVIGSTDPSYLGGDLYASAEAADQAADEAQAALESADPALGEEREKLGDEAVAARAFADFRQSAGERLDGLLSSGGGNAWLKLGGKTYVSFLLDGGSYHFLALAPASSVLKGTLNVWLVPLLIVELLLVYILSRVNREQKNRELRCAYVELGQTQRRLEIALFAAQKAAAVDELTGMMNANSFRKEMTRALEDMEDRERGILIMIDGDHFKQINDTYGHSMGDEVIKLSAQMIVGRIRTVDLASRLHGDEFAIFVANTDDCAVAKRIMEDINQSIAKEAQRRNMPAITLSAGAVVAKRGDSFNGLSKEADEVLYRAKATHDGGFAC